MGEFVPLDCGTGTTARAYFSPASRQHAPSVVVIQEWWGVQGQIRAVCDRYAAAGYNAIAPDLYAGKTVPYHDEEAASREMAAVNYLSATDSIVCAAANFLLDRGGKVGLTGFCLGGIVAIVGAVRLNNISAASAYYGAPGDDLVDASRIRVAVQGHFANRDEWCTPADADRMEAAFARSGRPYRVFRYEAAHAFANEESKEYDPHATALAWARDLEFWHQHLGGPGSDAIGV